MIKKQVCAFLLNNQDASKNLNFTWDGKTLENMSYPVTLVSCFFQRTHSKATDEGFSQNQPSKEPCQFHLESIPENSETGYISSRILCSSVANISPCIKSRYRTQQSLLNNHRKLESHPTIFFVQAHWHLPASHDMSCEALIKQKAGELLNDACYPAKDTKRLQQS